MDNKSKGLMVVGGIGVALGLAWLLTRGEAEAAPECERDSDCPPGYECVDGICVPIVVPPECERDSDCPAGYECVDGICVPIVVPPECYTDGDCPPGYECVDGICVPIVVPPPPPEGGYLDGTVYALGVKLEGVHIVADDMVSDMFWETWSGIDGHYLLDNLPVPADGSSLYLEVNFSNPGYTPKQITTTLNQTHPHRTNSVILVPTGGGNGGGEPIAYRDITGLVHGPAFQSANEIGPTVPIANASVTLYPPTPPGSAHGDIRTTITGSDGTYTFRDVPLYHHLETVMVKATAEGYQIGAVGDWISTSSPEVVELRPIYMKVERGGIHWV